MKPVSVSRFDRSTAQPITFDPVMIDVMAQAERAAHGDAKILITGESGVGKDVTARHIHNRSPRRNAEYVAVNCAGLTESLLESELFGHVKGSFTGAFRDAPGKLRLADGGTLFLDELGEMSLRMQALLLRFLENGEIQAVGSSRLQASVDVRVISATNGNLHEFIAQGRFREDLHYRLNVIHLHIPPLRSRPADIRPLTHHFLARSGRTITLRPEAWEVLEQYAWPGNVRELQNVAEQLIWMAQPDRPVEAAELPEVVRALPSLTATHERRRQVADDLYQAVVSGGYSFWDHIYPLFLARDITRQDMRELLRRGLTTTRGNYRSLLQLFRIPKSDYKRLLNFLAAHDCGVDYREFRVAPTAPAARVRVAPLAHSRQIDDVSKDTPMGHANARIA